MTRYRHFRLLGDVRQVTRTPLGVLLALDGGTFRIDIIRADIARMKLTRSGEFDEAPTRSACFEMPERAEFTLSEEEGRLVLATSVLRLSIARSPFSVEGRRADGSLLFDNVRGISVQNDEFLIERRAGADDSIYGLGEKTGPFERRGRKFVLWNVDVLAPNVLEVNRVYEADWTIPETSTRFDPYYTSIPFYQHVTREGEAHRAAGFLFDNPYKCTFDFVETDVFKVHFFGGQYTEYVFAGPELPAVLEAYGFVTGRMPLPPLWSLGHHQCRWHDYSAEQILEIGRQYRRRGIPCDALWLDIGYMEGFRVFTWSQERFPDPERALSALHGPGFQVVTIIDPGLKAEPGFSLYQQAVQQNLLCKTENGAVYTGQVWPGDTAFPDFSIERTRAFWADHVKAHLLRGVDGIWNDMNEPATGAIDPHAMRFDRDGENHSHDRFHNQYALLMALATRDGQLAARPGLRPFTLTRAGSPGIQRAAAHWLGDNTSSFEHLAMSLPMTSGMGVSGQPFVGADIPGFMGDANAELAARWVLVGALSPFCRFHNVAGAKEQYPWSFGPEVEAIARAAISLRYRLMPYLYACFLHASETSEPIQRPLSWDFPDDLLARDTDDQFMLGPGLLVAPVLAEGHRERDVYLPETSWFDWHTGARAVPGKRRVSAPLDTVPLFVRAGAIIPLYAAPPPALADFQPEVIELHAFAPDSDGAMESTLYEDDGRTFAYRDGAYLRTTLRLERRGTALIIRARVQGRGFPEHRREILRVVLHGVTPQRAELDGNAVSVTDRTLTFENSGQSFELVLTLAPGRLP